MKTQISEWKTKIRNRNHEARSTRSYSTKGTFNLGNWMKQGTRWIHTWVHDKIIYCTTIQTCKTQVKVQIILLRTNIKTINAENKLLSWLQLLRIFRLVWDSQKQQSKRNKGIVLEHNMSFFHISVCLSKYSFIFLL